MHERLLEVCWDEALGPIQDEAYQNLAGDLLGFEGVDGVDVLRYSALVRVAPHVVSASVLKAQLQAWLP